MEEIKAELTQLQQVAIEGELARAYSTANHDPEILYRFYSIMKKAPKEIKYIVFQKTCELVEIEKSKIQRVYLESLVDTTPTWLWIERTIEDLKLSLILGSTEINKMSVDKKMLRKKMIKSSFVYLCRNTAIISPSATIELCRAVLEREPLALDFLEEVCFSLIRQVSELDMDDKVSSELMDTSFDIRSILSFQTETEVLTEIIQEEDNNTENCETYEDSSQKDKEFIVAKKYAHKGIAVKIKSFKTEKEATEFLNFIKDTIGRDQNEFEFFIIGGKSGKND